MSDPRKNPEIVTEQELQPVLKNTAFDSAKFLEMYKQWKETKDSHIFAQLRAMHESAGYNNKNNFQGAEEEMHEIAAIVQKYHVGKVQTQEQVDEGKRDILGDFANKKQQEQDIRNALKEEIKKLDGKLEVMSMHDLDQALDGTIGILSMTWIEQVPGMKEMGKELLKYEPMIQGTVGKIMLQRLEQLGYYVQFIDKNKVKVIAHESKIQDEQDVTIKLNTYLAKNTVLGKALQSGSLYLQPSFSTFRDANLNQDGTIVDPAKVDLKSYVEYLRTKPAGERTVQEKLFLQTQQYFDSGIDFQKLLLQKSDYNKVESMMQQMGVNGSSSSGMNPSSAVDAGVPQSVFSGDRSSGVSSAAGAVGQGIGKVGGIIGKLAGAGAGGGMRVLTEVFSEATKHGGAWGALAVIGGLIWSIWKGPGFWGTLGGLFGIGLIDSAARKELTGLMGDSTTNPSTDTTAHSTSVASTEATGTSPDSTGNTPDTQQSFAGPVTDKIFLARALGRTGNLNESNVDAEMAIIQTIKGLNFQLLQKALSSRTQSDFQKLFEQYFPQVSTAEKEAIQKVMSSKNAQARKTIEAWVNAVANHKSYTNLTIDASFANMSVGQVMEYVLRNEQVKPEVTPSSETFTLSDGHSDLYLLSRLMTQGYIPQLSDNTIASIRSGESKGGRMWSTMKYLFWDGGPLTNNKDSKNSLVGAWHNGLQAKVSEYALEAAKEEKSMITQSLEAMKSKNIDSKTLIEAELMERKGRVDAIENALKKEPLDLKELQTAMANYEKSVKTKWEVLGNKLGMKIGANGWKIFKSVDAGAYVRKAESIVAIERKAITEADLNNFKNNGTLIENEGKKYKILDIKDGKVFYEGVDPVGSKAGLKIDDFLKYCNRPLEIARVQAEAIKLGEEIDAKKQAVLDKFTTWEADKASVEKQNAAMTALEDYNKRVIEVNGKISDNFALLTEAQAKELAKKLPKTGWLSEFIADNTKGTQFGWADKVDKWTSGTDYIKGARRGFVGVGLLSIAYNSVGGFSDLVKEGKMGTAFWRMFDLGIGMVPFVGAAHDILILNSKDYERWMLGADMSEDERAMRKSMVVLGMIPGVGMAVKGAGKVIKSGAMLTVGGTILKSGNMARSVAMYSLLGMSIVSTGFDIEKKASK